MALAGLVSWQWSLAAHFPVFYTTGLASTSTIARQPGSNSCSHLNHRAGPSQLLTPRSLDGATILILVLLGGSQGLAAGLPVEGLEALREVGV